MFFFALSGLVNAVTSFALVTLVVLKKTRTVLDKRFAWFAFFVGYWAFNYFLWLTATNYDNAHFLIRNTMAGAIFIPSTFMHLVLVLVENVDKRKTLIHVNYVISLLFFIFCFTPLYPLYITAVEPRLFFPFWPVPGLIFHLMLAHFIANVVWAHILMWQAISRTRGNKRNQIKYVFIGTLIGFVGGCTNYFLWYNIPIPPYLNFLVAIYIMTLAYAIVKYRLMDINVALIRTTIFISLYGFFLGVPAFLMGKMKTRLEFYFGEPWLLIVLLTYGVLTSIAPFLYLILQRKAEEQLLKDQRRYQQTLLQASRGMIRIKELGRLLNLTVRMLTRTIGITHASIFLYNETEGTYELKAHRGPTSRTPIGDLPKNSSLITHLKNTMEPLIAEEIRFQGPHETGSLLGQVEKAMEKLRAAVIIPSFVLKNILGFVILGEKRSKEMYSQDDLDTLTTLSNQAALAIENCNYVEEMRRTEIQLFQTKKMYDIGTMAAGMGHQMNNRLNVVKLSAVMGRSVNLPKLKKAYEERNDELFKQAYEELEKKILRVETNAEDGGKVSSSLLNLSRLSEGFEPVSIREAVERCVNDFLSHHKDLSKVNFLNEIPSDVPLIKGSMSHLTDVFFNFLDNAYDAILMKEEALAADKLPKPEHYYKGTITVSSAVLEEEGKKYLEVRISDTGIGMTEETMKKIFVPYFTTKATSIKGTGLGLHVIHRMVEAHQGEIGVESEYGIGTTLRIRFPLISGGSLK